MNSNAVYMVYTKEYTQGVSGSDIKLQGITTSVKEADILKKRLCGYSNIQVIKVPLNTPFIKYLGGYYE